MAFIDHMLVVLTVLIVGLIADTTWAKERSKTRKRTDLRVVSEAEVAVMLRSSKSKRIYVLLASSRGLVHSRNISKHEDRFVAVQVGAPQAGRIDQRSIDSLRQEDNKKVRAWLQQWSEESIDADDVLAGVMDSKSQAAWQGPSCERCQLRQRLGLIVLSMGLESKELSEWISIIGPNLQDEGQTILQMGEKLGRHWPNRLPIRSAYFAIVEPDSQIVEDLVIDWDYRGRASEKLSGLHRWHMAEVNARSNLRRSWFAFKHHRPKVQQRTASRARRAMQEALRSFRGVSLWHAELALAMALESPRSDLALKPMREALRLAPRSAKIRRICGRIYQVRGDWKTAGEYFATALRLQPNEPAIRRELEYILSQQNRTTRDMGGSVGQEENRALQLRPGIHD